VLIDIAEIQTVTINNTRSHRLLSGNQPRLLEAEFRCFEQRLCFHHQGKMPALTRLTTAYREDVITSRRREKLQDLIKQLYLLIKWIGVKIPSVVNNKSV
jgi:hypothetical protein